MTNNQSNNTIATFLDNIKTKEQRMINMVKGINGVLIIVTIINVLILLFPRWELSLSDQIARLSMLLGSILIILILLYIQRTYKKVNYNLSALEMLKQAAARFKFIKKRDFVATLAPVLLMDYGISYELFNHLNVIDPTQRIIITQLIYFGFWTVVLTPTYLIWRFKTKPLRDKALEFIEELES